MTDSYTAEILHQGQTYTVPVAADQTVLAAAAAAGLTLPNSCCAGVCTTCAARLLAGEVDQSEGIGISDGLMQQGYALLCIARPLSNLRLETEKEDEVYQLQFGQFQKT
ncbi:2Fe-2S iron-sulfur cluster-binding protein [Leptolyngbya sp. FACHB-261]|uniref:2Fe-2S iron-sulfur cluster-binding protein n=1 Tax=Leptolyngbya sp. FACHB-261 TaxID=2692806 RepID=UPI0016848394|nr:2Fe-2S iron-sulfur cluster-binding protein [Leptolyngbya sp. FACHB-261]MBD2099352.1 2Fe-2S iron-sulfur cluster binding domain-containing protein [Leptolyngbya sp. FACHB-261]